MILYIDADSFPVPARAVICRAAERRKLKAIFVARLNPGLPKSPLIRFQAAPDGPDAADRIILEHSRPEDLVFTRDIPLAALLVAKGVLVLNDRGVVYSSENVRTRLSERDFMAELRERNLPADTSKSYGQRDLAEFANAFDRELTRRLGPLAVSS